MVRASTAKQTTEDQTAELEKWAISEGYTKREQRIVIDCKESGRQLDVEDRLGITQMKRNIESNPNIDCVYAWSISRIGRRLNVNADAIDFLVNHKIQFKTKVEPFTLLDRDGKWSGQAVITYGVFSAMAQNGADEIKANTVRGKNRSMQEGKSATGRLLFGYTKDENGIIQEDTPKADIIRDIFRWYVEKDIAVVNIYREIVDKGIFKESTTERSGIARIRDILKNPAYYGEKHQKKHLKVKDKDGKLVEKERVLTEHKRYPALITKETFDAAQKRLEERISKPKVNTKNVYYAKGLMRFMGMEEPHKMVANRQTITYRVPDNLHRFSISINAIDTILWEAATHLYVQMLSKSTLQEIERLKALIPDNETKIITAQKKIKELDAKKEKAYQAFEDGGITREKYKERIAQLTESQKEHEAKIVKNKERIKFIENQIKKQGDGEWRPVDVDEVKKIKDDSRRKEIIDKVIESIDITPLDEGCEIRIEVYDYVNALGYPHTYTYKSKGGRIKLFRHTHRITGEVITTDVSDSIIKRFERTDSKGDRHKDRKKKVVVATPIILDD